MPKLTPLTVMVKGTLLLGDSSVIEGGKSAVLDFAARLVVSATDSAADGDWGRK